MNVFLLKLPLSLLFSGWAFLYIFWPNVSEIQNVLLLVFIPCPVLHCVFWFCFPFECINEKFPTLSI